MLTSEGQSQITQSLVGDKEAVSTWPTGPNLFLDPKGPKVSILTTPHREANLKTEEKNVFWQWKAQRTHLKTQRKEGKHVQNRAIFRTPGLAVSGTTACWVIASLSSYLWAKFYKQACSCHPDSAHYRMLGHPRSAQDALRKLDISLYFFTTKWPIWLCAHISLTLLSCESLRVDLFNTSPALGSTMRQFDFAQSSFLKVPLKWQLSFNSPVLRAGLRL